MLDFLAEDVEADGLAEGSALSDGNNVTGLDTESWGAMDGNGLMALLEPVVLLDVMEVITSDDDGSGHLAVDNNTLENSSADGNVAGEGALLVNVGSLDGGLGSLEAKSNLFVESNAANGLFGHHLLGGKEHALLLLEGLFSLEISHLWGCI